MFSINNRTLKYSKHNIIEDSLFKMKKHTIIWAQTIDDLLLQTNVDRQETFVAKLPNELNIFDIAVDWIFYKLLVLI
jgi:hypothetical protein